MSLECSECERDLRGGHDPSCSRYRLCTHITLSHSTPAPHIRHLVEGIIQVTFEYPERVEITAIRWHEDD